MYNVLPEESQKSLKREYILRLVVVVSCFVGVIIFSSSVLLIPSYVITLQKKYELNQELAEINVKSAETNLADTASATKELQEKLKTLSVLPDEKLWPHAVLSAIVNEKGPMVTINRFNYELLVGTTTSVTIEGFAKTIEDLLAFKSRLKKIKRFSQIDFPDNLLVKTRNINFTMTLK